jgi:phosphatidylglycerophosphate synthase
MRERTWTLATIVTLGRIAFLPVLWLWALDGRVAWVGIGVMASFLADILDGQLARRLGQVTRLGSQLDTVADALLEVSSVVWLVWFRPEILEEPYRAATLLAVSSWLAVVAVGLLRFRRFLNLHLYSGKASGVCGALFVLDALAFGFHAPTFALAFGVFTLANLESLLILLTRSHVDEHIGSILRRPAPMASAPGGLQ